jgi:hypothetical protein
VRSKLNEATGKHLGAFQARQCGIAIQIVALQLSNG